MPSNVDLSTGSVKKQEERHVSIARSASGLEAANRISQDIGVNQFGNTFGVHRGSQSHNRYLKSSVSVRCILASSAPKHRLGRFLAQTDAGYSSTELDPVYSTWIARVIGSAPR
jgi:hypothetical protein